MRRLKPLTILVLGSFLTATVTCVAFFVYARDARNLRGTGIAVGWGVTIGLLLFAPIALAERFRVTIGVWLKRRWPRIQPRATFIMGLSLGYVFASARHHAFDVLTFIAIGLVFVAALFGSVVEIAGGRQG